MAIPFEFVIEGPPVSQQIRNRRRPGRREEWMQTVRTAAERRWDGEPPFMGEVAVTITYVSSRARLDVDNIPKPILDALTGLVYADDRQVADLVCRRKSLDPNLRIRNASPLFYESFRAGEQFLHVAVGNALVQEVIF